MTTRYKELDSLRGLAALSVLAYHYLIILTPFAVNSLSQNNSWYIYLLKYTPLHIFWAGQEAVILFFILSGFVLSLKFYSNKNIPYLSFLISRFCRIFLPSYVALVFAIILNVLLSRHGIPELSQWFNSIWKEPITRGMVVNHLLLLRYFGYGQYNPVLWTLVMEVRISLIFPFLITMIKYLNWKINLLIGCGLSLFYYIITDNGRIQELFHIPSDYFYTITFIQMFIIGALIAKNRDYLIKQIQNFSKNRKIILLTTAILLYTIRYWSYPFTGHHLNLFLIDLCISIAVVVFILLALATSISSLLKQKIIHFLGKISYSIYLYHGIVLLSLTYLLYAHISIIIIWLLGVFITFFISYISYKYVELPSVKFGKAIINITEKIDIND